MKRKIIRQGNGSFTITLPVQWIRKNRVADDSYVSVQEKNNEISISLDPGQSVPGKVSIHLSTSHPNFVRTAVSGLYRRGYDIIEVRYDKISKRLFYEICSSLYGFEIIEDDKNTITFQNVSNEPDLNISSILHRMFISIEEMLARINGFIDNPCRETIEPLKDLDSLKSNNIKLRDLCLRLINQKQLYEDKSYELYSMILSIEKISGECRRIAEHISSIKNGAWVSYRNNQRHFRALQDIFHEFNISFFKKDVFALLKLGEKCRDSLLTSLTRTNKKSTRHESHILGSLKYILESLFSANSRAIAILIVLSGPDTG